MCDQMLRGPANERNYRLRVNASGTTKNTDAVNVVLWLRNISEFPIQMDQGVY